MWWWSKKTHWLLAGAWKMSLVILDSHGHQFGYWNRCLSIPARGTNLSSNEFLWLRLDAYEHLQELETCLFFWSAALAVWYLSWWWYQPTGLVFWMSELMITIQVSTARWWCLLYSGSECSMDGNAAVRLRFGGFWSPFGVFLLPVMPATAWIRWVTTPALGCGNNLTGITTIKSLPQKNMKQRVWQLKWGLSAK